MHKSTLKHCTVKRKKKKKQDRFSDNYEHHNVNNTLFKKQRWKTKQKTLASHLPTLNLNFKHDWYPISVVTLISALTWTNNLAFKLNTTFYQSFHSICICGFSLSWVYERQREWENFNAFGFSPYLI